MRLSGRLAFSRQVSAALLAVSTAGLLLAVATPASASKRFDAVHTCVTKALAEFPDDGGFGAHRSREFSYRACMAAFGQRA